MIRRLCSLFVGSLVLLPVAWGQETVISAQIKIQVGPEDKAPVGQLDLDVEYLGRTLMNQRKIGAGQAWVANHFETLRTKLNDRLAIDPSQPVKLTAELGDTRGPIKWNNCILSFAVRLITDKGTVYVGETEDRCFDTETGGKCKGGGVGKPNHKFEIR